MFDIKIDKDIPIPKTSRNSGYWKHLAEIMEVEDSVFLADPPKDKKGKLAVLTRLYAYKPKKFRCLPEKNGARLWRVK